MGHTVRFLLLVPILVIAANPEGKRGAAVLEEVPVTPKEGSASEFSYAPGADRIAYRLDWAYGCVGLWVCDRAGGNHLQVAPDTESERLHVLALSPDGQHLAYARATHDSPPRILGVGVVEVASGRKLELEGTSAAWTRKGDRLAVADPAGGTIAVVEVASLERRTLAKTPRAGDPYEQRWMSWSPDGSKLAYTMRDAEGPIVAVWVAGLDGADPRLVFADEDGCETLQPLWATDGRIAWRLTSSKDPSGTRHFAQAADGNVTEIGRGVPIAPAGPSVWSPDGRAIVFPRTVVPEKGDAPPMTDLWELEVQTGELRRLTESGDAFGEPVWSASGEALFLQEPGRLRCARIGAR